MSTGTEELKIPGEQKAEADPYSSRPIKTAIVGIGARAEHSIDEHIYIEDMEKGQKMVVEILRLAAEFLAPSRHSLTSRLKSPVRIAGAHGLDISCTRDSKRARQDRFLGTRPPVFLHSRNQWKNP